MTGHQREAVRMTDGEVAAFLEQQRTATMCSVLADGTIHAVAMWYAVVDGEVIVTTKAKSQKVRNLQRDSRLTVLVADGESYSELRGVEVVGRAEIVDDPEVVLRVGILLHRRYVGPYSDDQRAHVEAAVKKRVAIRLKPNRVVSWDHRKLAVT